MNKYLKLKPHEQIKLGAVVLVLYSIISPTLFAILMIFVGGASFGRVSESFQSFVLWSFLIVGMALLISGILLPIVRMLSISHKFSKQLGRGDEHIIFIMGILILFLTWIFTYRPFQATVTETDSDSSIFNLLFLSGNILGLLFLIIGTFLLIRMSNKYYQSV